jgi:tripartite-type tricarboxylate transporter receptor subunit TctC
MKRSLSGWVGVSDAHNLPPLVIETWNKTLQEMAKDPEMVSKMRNVGLEPYYLNSKEVREFLLREIEEGRALWVTK